ncbi:unnamed protein product [Sphagnum jensenii]|uniref:Uncharacterized protein n=2 Tax=Sphagnum jensenii TaxID=128206 RepID=A0ABP0XG22_9BRYO
MPKTAKRSSIAAPSSLQQQSKSTPDHHHHESYSPRSSSSSPSIATDQSQSALKSLSSIFPELAALTQQEKKPMISSVFEDGEYPDPTSTETSGSSSSSSGISSFAADVDPADPNTFYSYLNDLMDDEPEENKCMFVQASAFQAMAKELGDLIGDHDSPTTPYSDHSRSSEKDPEIERWLEGVLSGPLPAEVPEQGLKDETTNTKSFANHESAASHEDLLQIFDSGNNNNGSWTAAAAYNNGLTGEVYVPGDHGGGAGASPRLSMIDRYKQLDSVSRSEVSEDVDDVLHMPNMSSHVPKPIMSQQLSNGHHGPPVDLSNLLLRCAQAVEQNDISHASELIAELRQHSSPYGSGAQRTAHYFTEALVARMSRTGFKLYTALTNNRPSASEMLKAFRLFVECVPLTRLSHVFLNLAIMHAIGDAKRVHIVDYGILYGVQWPCFIYHFSRLPGPPHLRITGIDLPQSGFRPSERIQETGRRLARVAEHVGVPFEFHAIAEKWEAITPAHLLLRNDEVLAVNCAFRLRHLLDESVVAASPRDLVLNRIRSMNPKIFVEAVVNSGYNAPFFMSRFRAGLSHLSTLFEAFDASMPYEIPERITIEKEMFGRQILNIVACEGLERVERAEPYKQWHSRITRAGFRQLPIMEKTRVKIRSMMRNFHRDYGIGEDGAWFLSGWKDKILHAMSVWEPIPISP